MSTRQPIEHQVTWRQVAAFRLARHHLTERAPGEALVAAAGEIAGVQAQLLSAAQMALWARVQGLQTAQVDQAIRDRALVKAACMRQTLFLVPAKHLAVFVRGSARRAEKEIRWARGKGVPERIIDAAIQAALDVLDQPLTRVEITERISRVLGNQPRTFQGGVGWGSRKQVPAIQVGDLTLPVVYFLHLVAARGVVCSGPNRLATREGVTEPERFRPAVQAGLTEPERFSGIEPTFVRADAWIPQWQDMPKEQAELALLRVYLRAFGPATAADFALWSGMTLTDAREIWAREQANLSSVNVEGWAAEILGEDVDALAQAEFEPPLVRLLPYFDTFLLGHKERAHLMSRAHQPSVYRPQGWVAPVVLVNGRAVAVWEYVRQKERLQITLSAFDSLAPDLISRIHAVAQDLGRFLEAPVIDLQING